MRILGSASNIRLALFHLRPLGDLLVFRRAAVYAVRALFHGFLAREQLHAALDGGIGGSLEAACCGPREVRPTGCPSP